MSDGPVLWSDELLPPHGRFVPIVRTPAEGRSSWVILGDRALGVIGHWDRSAGRTPQGRFVPCAGDACPCCARELGKLQFFYLSVWVPTHQRPGVAELRGEAMRRCPDLLPARKLDLRGRRLRLGRDPRSKGGRHVYELGELTTDDPASLPPGVDVMRFLLWLWGLAPKMEAGSED